MDTRPHRQSNRPTPPVDARRFGVFHDPDGLVTVADVWIGPMIYRGAALVILLVGDPDPAIVIVDPQLRERLRDDDIGDLLADRLRLAAA
jgi:hypothetical protein